MSKQTAVELLKADLDLEMKLGTTMVVNWDRYLAIEKENLIDAWENGDNNGADRIYYHSDRDDKSPEQYYNETFNK